MYLSPIQMGGLGLSNEQPGLVLGRLWEGSEVWKMQRFLLEKVTSKTFCPILWVGCWEFKVQYCK